MTIQVHLSPGLYTNGEKIERAVNEFRLPLEDVCFTTNKDLAAGEIRGMRDGWVLFWEEI